MDKTSQDPTKKRRRALIRAIEEDRPVHLWELFTPEELVHESYTLRKLFAPAVMASLGIGKKSIRLNHFSRSVFPSVRNLTKPS